MTRFLIAVSLLTAGCSGSPTTPTVTRQPLAITGQSQVGIFAPYVVQAYAGPVVSAWEGGSSIAFWGPEDRLWRQLVPLLHAPLAALVYAQGESDCAGLSTAVTDYAPRFVDLMTRIRIAVHDPTLLIVVVTVSPLDSCAEVRRVQADWVAGDAHARLVSSDDLPRLNFPLDIHLTAGGAARLADRIVAAVP